MRLPSTGCDGSSGGDVLPYTEPTTLFILTFMKPFLRLWARWLALLLCLLGLSACSSLTSLWHSVYPEPPADSVDFSHAMPKAPSDLKRLPREETWSPSTWVQVDPAVAAQANAPERAATLGTPALTLYFDNDQYHLKPAELQRLRHFVRNLKIDGTLRLQLAGHTDNNHSPEYNVGLSQNRSETVRQWLVQLGIPANQIVISWFGLRQPAASNTTDEGRALNRRVEIHVQRRNP
ncbi:MAG: hypothetical protein RLZZ352_1167 [Pseudomonadota bacterium]|jgi:outer membrane protein OmpA-like peptidoglycan-associated protein